MNEKQDKPCPFCAIIAGEAPAEVIEEWDDALAVTPIGPVTSGHVLVFPKKHVEDFTTDPSTAARTMYRAATLGKDMEFCNLITSKGIPATQSVFHVHYHLVPRAENDGLALPWYSGKTKKGHL